MTDDPHAALELATADAEAKLRDLIRPYLRQAQKLGFRSFFKVEPEVVLANGTTIFVRVVSIKLVAESPRAKSACYMGGRFRKAILAEGRYVELIDAEACIVDTFETAIETAKQVV